jgi:CelD/BcsL family acetyltransferase involved in cellulose biosynthesis
MRENRTKTGRASDGRFMPGASGNPGGRPKIEKLSELRDALLHHVPRAIEVLRELIEDTHAAPSIRLAASQAVLDRCFGRAALTTTVAEDDGFEAILARVNSNMLAEPANDVPSPTGMR